MTKWKWYIPLSCIIALHSPDGTELRFEAHNFTAIQALPHGYKQHVAHGTKTIVYGSGGNKFGVTETPEEIAALAAKCGDGGLNLDKSMYGIK